MIYKKISNDSENRDDVNHKYAIWDGVFNEEELEKICQYCKTFEMIDGQVSEKGEVREKTRISKTVFFGKYPENQWIFDRLNYTIEKVNEDFFNFDLNGYESIQYSEYDGKRLGKYDFHMDMTFGIQDKPIQPRKISVVMMLSDQSEYEGGEFLINCDQEDNAETVEMIKGRIVVFPSYMIHKVNPTTSGIRKSLVIWVKGPKFR